MPLSANPAAWTSLIFITVGALMDVWAGVWYWYMATNPSETRSNNWWYVCTGILLSGVVFIVIGLLTGRIGREARHADKPPASPDEAKRSADAQGAQAAHTQAMQANAGTPQTGGAP